ncbi:MAG TPA: hypothetical protein VD973_08155 [Symbiobacteriaceae bacterium]|nr:hypothetical protein [Symbiobacteriaceae bacterium]
MRGRTGVAVMLLLAVAGGTAWYGTGLVNTGGPQSDNPGIELAAPSEPGTMASSLGGLGVEWVGGNSQPEAPVDSGSDGLGVDWAGGNTQPTEPGGGSSGSSGSDGGLGVDWLGGNTPAPEPGGGSSDGLGLKWLIAITPEQRQALTRQIEGAYVQFLARKPTKAELEAEFKLLEADAELRNSESITSRAVALLQRDPASQEAVIRKAYMETRRREPTAAEMQTWRQRLSADPPPYLDVAAEVGNGPDPLYGAGICQNTVLTEAVTRVMGRAPEGSGLTGECNEQRWGPFKTVDEAERSIAKTIRVWAVCTDPVMTEMLWRVTGREPEGYKTNLACDPERYGEWDEPAELEKQIAIAYKKWGTCYAPDLTRAITEVMGRPPEGYWASGECEAKRYGGTWKDYADLKIRVGTAFQKNLLTEPMIREAFLIAYGRSATADEVKYWLNMTGKSPYVRSVESLLASLRISLFSQNIRQDVLQRAVSEVFKKPWDQGLHLRYRFVLTQGVFYRDLKPMLAGILVDEAFKRLLQRAADSEGRQHYINLMVNQGWEPERIWAAIARSQERLDRFGYFAPHQTDYNGKRELCFGAIGPKCDGAPKSNPEWVDKFYRADGVEMGYIRIQVSVGSILHDNACTRNGTGIMCNGLIKGLTQDQLPLATYMQPAGLEWNKAVYNTIDNRFWTATFGPYPTNTRLQDTYSDDLTPVANRASKMAPVVSVPFAGAGLGAIPLPIIDYTGGETRQSAVLKAPPGTALDAGDDAFCASGSAKGTGDLWALLLTKYWINCN